MGDLTRGQLLFQAGLAAGDDSVSTFARTWLDAWLKRTAKSWMWPLLKSRVRDLPIAAGAASVGVGIGYPTTIGNGVDSLDFHVHRLLNGVVFWRSASGYSPNGRAFIRPFNSVDPSTDESVSDPLGRMGYPETIKVRQAADGALGLYPNPTPKVPLLFSMDVLLIPPSLTTGSEGDVEVPWYPNDKTLLQAVKVAILESGTSGEKSALFDDESAKLADMVSADREFDGEQAGDNEILTLDRSVFR